MTIDAPIRNLATPPASREPSPSIHVTTWEDVVLDRVGMDPRGTYAELFWLPVVGPSALLLLRRLTDRLDQAPDGIVLDPDEMAQTLGIGGPGSRHQPLARALARCERFGLLRRTSESSALVRRRVGPVPRYRLDRLTRSLQEAHRAWEVEVPDGSLPQRRARTGAVDLALLGEGPAMIERRLLRAGTHPALAYDAATWAAARWGNHTPDVVSEP